MVYNHCKRERDRRERNVDLAQEDARSMEFEVRGGPWEIIHALVFYAAVTFAVLATAGVARLFSGICAVVLLFYSILAIFSSPTYVVILPEEKALIWEDYRFFVPLRRRFARENLEMLEVLESGRLPSEEGISGSGRDLSYSVHVYLKPVRGRKRKLFRSGMTGHPLENRAKAYLVVESLAHSLNLPVFYAHKHGPRKDVGGQSG